MSAERKDWTPATIEDVQGVKLTPSGAALVCRIAGKPDFTVPCSLIDEDSETYKPGTEGTLVIPTWLAIEKGLV